MMEEFRPVVVDLAVINMIKSGQIAIEDFQPSPDGLGIWLGSVAKKLFIAELENQFSSSMLYPSQNRHLRLGQIILEQVHLLGRCLVERTLDYEPFVLR